MLGGTRIKRMKDGTARSELTMLVAVLAAIAISAIGPHSVTVWLTELFWALGLLAVLLATRRKFRFSTTAYACFFVWLMLQVVGAHYTFELVPMDWLMEPLGLVRNPYDRIAHFTVGWFAFPFAELFLRKGWVKSTAFAAFFAIMTVVAMAGLWELVEWQYAVIDGGDAGAATSGMRRRTSFATPLARLAPERCFCFAQRNPADESSTTRRECKRV